MSEKSKTKEVLQLSVAYGTLSPCFIRYLKVSLQNGKTAWKKNSTKYILDIYHKRTSSPSFLLTKTVCFDKIKCHLHINDPLL